jgi:hypothetical protein
MPDTAVPMPFMQELSAGHALAMQSGARAIRFLDRAAAAGPAGWDERASLEALRMAGLAARLMAGVQRVVPRLRGLPAAGLDPALGLQGTDATSPAAAAQAGRAAASAQPKLHAAPGQRRGCLKNGNPAGDYLKSPRCGARTRAGCGCRQPAMASPGGGRGRCRLHGGLSTGPRTPEGLARCRAARLQHGYRSGEVIGLRRRAAHAARRLRSLARTLSAGHGVHRSISATSAAGATPCGRLRAATVMQNQGAHAGSPLRKRPIGSTSPAGHEVHRSDSIEGTLVMTESNQVATASASPRLRVESSTGNRAIPAGHGLHRSYRDHLRSSASTCPPYEPSTEGFGPQADFGRRVCGSPTTPANPPLSAGHLPAVRALRRRLRAAGGLRQAGGLHRLDCADRRPLT